MDFAKRLPYFLGGIEDYANACIVRGAAIEKMELDAEEMLQWVKLTRQLTKQNASSDGIYVASKCYHGPMWRHHRDNGRKIVSTWIDEYGEGETSDWPDLWSRCVNEARSAKAVILYSVIGEELKGALIETGAALSAGRPVFTVGVPDKHSWINHPLVTRCETITEAFEKAEQWSVAWCREQLERPTLDAEWARNFVGRVANETWQWRKDTPPDQGLNEVTPILYKFAAELQSRLAQTTDQQLRETGERLLAFTTTLRDDLQEYRIYNEAKAVFAPPAEAEKGTGGK